MLRVDTAPLPDGLHELELTPTAEDLGLDPEAFENIAIALRLDVSEHRVLASFGTHATAILECDRTLAMYRQVVEGSHEVLFTSSPIQDEDEDVFPLPQQGQEIDITDPVRDTILLSLPLRRVAPEAVETDIPTRFGAPDDDEPADHRWDALRRLRDLPSDEDGAS